MPRKMAPARWPLSPEPKPGLRKSLLVARKLLLPRSTLSAGPSFQVDAAGLLPEITKKDLCLRGKAYYDRTLEQLREKNGLRRVRRPPAYTTGGPGSGSAKKGSASAPGSA